jgi:prepilin-type N-terminal cleavage/methylation domain-containing protein
MRMIPRRRAGFTLPELVVSMLALSLVLAGATITLLRMQQQYTAQRETVEARETIRALELLLARLFRTSGANPRNLPAADVRMVVNPLGSPGVTWTNVDLRADFNPADGTLTGHFENARVALLGDTVYVRITDGGPLEPVAYPVSRLRFQFYAADSTEITDAAAAAAGARRVRITIGVPVKKTSTTLGRELWVSLRN